MRARARGGGSGSIGDRPSGGQGFVARRVVVRVMGPGTAAGLAIAPLLALGGWE
jgi:hypothetical protein